MIMRHDFHSHIKVYYRPIEAAIRWSGLSRCEDQILKIMDGKTMPAPSDWPQCPKWALLRLNTERIYDAILNRELPFGIRGVPVNDEPPDHPDLTVRHVDLKSWMSRYYPDQRPGFLFSAIERRTHPTVTIADIQAMTFERNAFKARLTLYERENRTLRAQNAALRKENEALTPAHAEALSERSEVTYLHIVGGMLTLLLGHTPSGQPYSSFKTQESIISAMIAHHGERLGITERTLQAKFAAANRKLTGI
jgi:hypothetical protein